MAGEVRIVERWHQRERHVVLDTHFDFGLNFLATWNAWRADPHRSQQLHYVAVESRPYTASAMTALHADWPQLKLLSQELMLSWPTMVAGFHRLLLAGGAVVLTLIFGDVEEDIAQIEAQVDTFYLNGKWVSTIPESRAATLLTLLGRLAAPQAILALEPALPADTVALKNSGFAFEPQAIGRLACFAPRWTPRPVRIVNAADRHVIVIGAGLAGSAASERLAARGWQISLIEQHQQAAQEASGNTAGIFMPTLAKDDNSSARLTRAAFLFALRLWQRLGGVGQAFSGEVCGVLQLARDAARASVAQEIAEIYRFPPEFAQWLSADAVANLPGMPPLADAGQGQHGAWLFPRGGWVHPAGLCEALLAACSDKLQKFYGRNAVRIERVAGVWQVFDDHGVMIATAPHVIIANGVGFRQFVQTVDLPLDRVRGQVTHLPAASLPDLPLVLCREGYVTPPLDGVCSLGASYDMDDDPSLRLESQHENLARLDQILPHMSSVLMNPPLSGRVGFRCVSADRLPIVGALADQLALAHFHGDRLREVPRLPGLYALLGYASRGLIWAPLAAELLAAQIAGEPLPLERELAATLDPARFLLAVHRRSHKKDK
jgi:tRNA 5-methylaminomethyl-2-thiouridine biosynthesis bifunctional protein